MFGSIHLSVAVHSSIMSCIFLKMCILNWHNLNTEVTFYFEMFSHVTFLLELGGVSLLSEVLLGGLLMFLGS